MGYDSPMSNWGKEEGGEGGAGVGDGGGDSGSGSGASFSSGVVVDVAVGDGGR